MKGKQIITNVNRTREIVVLISYEDGLFGLLLVTIGSS